jgi:hypothetical protein
MSNPTDTILIIRCLYCISGLDFNLMIAHKDGRFICRDCAHTVRPGMSDYRCTCRPCLKLRKALQADKGVPPEELQSFDEVGARRE